MQFLEIFLFAIGVVGMTHIIVDSTVFQPVRDWFDKHLPEKISKVIHCYQCMGFWCGLIGGYFAFSNIGITQIFMAGCGGSILANFGAIYLNYLEAQTIINLPDNEGK